MLPRHLSTIQVARAVDVHPNTVRLYEAWGFLPPVPRSRSGYRLYTARHVDQMRLARAALHGGWAGRTLRRSALELVRRSAAGDLAGALALAERHLALVQGELGQAEAAAAYLQQWAESGATAAPAGGQQSEPPAADGGLEIGAVADLLQVSRDVLRNWERDGLVSVPRAAQSSYRRYGPAEIGRLRVIRTLRQAGYSPMAILRMLLQFDQGRTADLAQVLDTPRPDEEVYSASDRWLSTLAEQEQRAHELIAQVQAMLRKE